MPGKFETTRVLLSHAGKISINANETQHGYQTSLSYRPIGVSSQTVGRETHATRVQALNRLAALAAYWVNEGWEERGYDVHKLDKSSRARSVPSATHFGP
jgi:hypothetical protein